MFRSFELVLLFSEDKMAALDALAKKSLLDAVVVGWASGNRWEDDAVIAGSAIAGGSGMKVVRTLVR